MFCYRCGKKLGSTQYCLECGANGASTTSGVHSSYIQNVTCPQCGFTGPMGFVREVRPVYANCFVLGLLFITVVGIVAILLLAILGKMRSASEVVCPHCGLVFQNRK